MIDRWDLMKFVLNIGMHSLDLCSVDSSGDTPVSNVCVFFLTI